MKTITSFVALMLLVSSLPAVANNYSQSGGTRQETCYTNVYREEYVPGTQNQPGRVRSWTERQEVPCEENTPSYVPAGEPRPRPQPVDDNSCIEGAVLGGLAGGAAGAGLSRDEGNFIGIPLGVVAGALIGCQIDGG